jgi:MFS family permease
VKIVPLFVIFYGLMLSMGNLGPGDMLGLVSSESYATAVRGTCYGFSAAIGKTGAVVGTQAFLPIKTNLGNRWTFIIAALCGIVGVIVTFFFIPNIDGRDLALEDEKFRAYLVRNGWVGEMGEEDLKALAPVGIESTTESLEMEREADAHTGAHHVKGDDSLDNEFNHTAEYNRAA